MKSLELIIENNARAAGRECRHAINDGNHDLADAITSAHFEDLEIAVKRDRAAKWSESPAADIAFVAFNRGENAARKEG